MRNHSLDFLKGFMALGILLIHTGSFIITPPNLSNLDSYIYAMTSLFVPVFFIISGYFFAKSRNRERAIGNIIITYLLYMGLIVIFDTILLGISYDSQVISEIVLYTGGLGNFWFVNSLIYFMFFYLLLDKMIRLEFDKLFWLIVMILGFNLIYYLNTDASVLWRAMDFVYFSAGFIIAKIKFLDNVKISSNYLFLLVIYPFTVGMTYDAYGLITLCFGLLLFIAFKSIGLKENAIGLYSKYSLLLLFVHYYVIVFLNKVDVIGYIGDYYVINFLVVLGISLVIVHLVDFISSGCMLLIDTLKRKMHPTPID